MASAVHFAAADATGAVVRAKPSEGVRDQNDEIITRERDRECCTAALWSAKRKPPIERVRIVVAAAFKISPGLNLKKGVNVSSLAISFARDFEVGVVHAVYSLML